MSKPLTTLLLVFALILAMPIFIGIVGGLFGAMMGVFGAAIGIVAGVFGAVFGAIGAVFGALFGGGWNLLCFILAAVAIVLIIGRR